MKNSPFLTSSYWTFVFLFLLTSVFAQSDKTTSLPSSGIFKPSSTQIDIEYGYGKTIFDDKSEETMWDAIKSRAGFFQELMRRYPSVNFRRGEETSFSEYAYLCDGTIQFSYVAPLAMHIMQIHGETNNFLVVVGLEKPGVAFDAGIKIWDQIIAVNKSPFSKATSADYETDEGVFTEFASFFDKAQERNHILLEVRRYIEPKFRMDAKSYERIESAIIPQDEKGLESPYLQRIAKFPETFRKQLSMDDPRFYKKAQIPVKIKKEGAFSKTFPHRCLKSQKLKSIVVKELINGSENGHLVTGNSNPLAGLALLAHADLTSHEALENYVLRAISDVGDKQNFINGNTNYIAKSSIGGSWGNGMSLVFLCEYFHATHDMRVFPIIQKLALDASFKHLNPFGGGGHGMGGLGSYFDYSFGAPSALNILASALSKKVGAKVNENVWKRYYDCYTNRIDRVINEANNYSKAINASDVKFDFQYDKELFYGAHYMARMFHGKNPGFWEQAFTSATAGLALYHMPKVGFSKEIADNIINHVKLKPFQHAYIHASPLLGLFWCHLAVGIPEYMRDPKTQKMRVVPNYLNQGIRNSLANRKAHILFTTTENGRYFYPFPKRTRFSAMGGGAVGGGWGGDGYLNMKGITLSCTALFLASDKRNFLLHDNNRGAYLLPKNTDKSKSAATLQNQIKAYHTFYLNERLKELSSSSFDTPESLHKLHKDLKFLVDNYAGISGHDKARNMLMAIYRKVGRERVEQNSIKFDCIEHVHYVIKGHERANGKDEDGKPSGVQGSRKKWLLYVASKFIHHPISKLVVELANRDDIQTLNVDAELEKLSNAPATSANSRNKK